MSVTHSGIAVSRAWEKRKLLREIGAKLPWSKSLGNGNLFWFEIYREIWEIGGLRNWYSSVISVLLNSHLFTNFFNLNLPLLNFCVLYLMNPFWFNDLHIFAGKVERTKQYRQATLIVWSKSNAVHGQELRIPACKLYRHAGQLCPNSRISMKLTVDRLLNVSV